MDFENASVVRRGFRDETNKGEEYTVVMRRNYFKVDSPIILVGLGFFGPVQKVGAYDITFDVRHIYRDSPLNMFGVFGLMIGWMRDRIFAWMFGRPRRVPNPIIGSGVTYLVAQQHEMMHVAVGNLRIPANKWIEVGFVLDGPKTGCMKETADTDLSDQVVEDVHFSFMRGSKQMPLMFFKLQQEP